MTVVKGLAVAGVVGLLALAGARACDDFGEEMALAAAREAFKAKQTAEAAPQAQADAQAAVASATATTVATVAPQPQQTAQAAEAVATRR